MFFSLFSKLFFNLFFVVKCTCWFEIRILGNRLQMLGNESSLTIIPRARMGSASIAHKAEGLMGYWLRSHVGERNNCFSKIQLVSQKYRE